jgi:hypothetical protein
VFAFHGCGPEGFDRFVGPVASSQRLAQGLSSEKIRRRYFAPHTRTLDNTRKAFDSAPDVGCLNTAITFAGGVRYLRITFDPHRRQLSDAEEFAVIGHELQHALEIAEAPEVRTSDHVIRLFRRIGFSPRCPRGLSDCYETQAARLIGDRIRDELMPASANR